MSAIVRIASQCYKTVSASTKLYAMISAHTTLRKLCVYTHLHILLRIFYTDMKRNSEYTDKLRSKASISSRVAENPARRSPSTTSALPCRSRFLKRDYHCELHSVTCVEIASAIKALFRARGFPIPIRKIFPLLSALSLSRAESNKSLARFSAHYYRQ